jgi:hypothetical protein
MAGYWIGALGKSLSPSGRLYHSKQLLLPLPVNEARYLPH